MRIGFLSARFGLWHWETSTAAGRPQAWGAGRRKAPRRHGVPAPHTLLGCYVNDDAAWVVEGEDVERFDTVNADDELGSAFKR